MPQKKFYIGICTPTGQAQVETISKIDAVVMSMGILPTYVVTTAGFFTQARRKTIETIYSFPESDDVKVRRGLLLDSDIVIRTSAEELKNILLDVEKKKLNIAGMYHNTNNKVLIFKDNRALSVEEYDALENHAKIDYAGLGFYYGDIPKDYIFHMDSENGEDKYFFLENPQLDVRVEKRLNLLHSKMFTI